MSQSSLTRSMAATVESIFLVLDPHGGQRTARRNALRALSVDAANARGRRLAAEVLPGTPAVVTPAVADEAAATR